MFEERFLMGDGEVLEVRLFEERVFTLACRRKKQTLVEYKYNGKGCMKILRGRESPYEFKSVEKLRYDFERDVENALRQG